MHSWMELIRLQGNYGTKPVDGFYHFSLHLYWQKPRPMPLLKSSEVEKSGDTQRWWWGARYWW